VKRRGPFKFEEKKPGELARLNAATRRAKEEEEDVEEEWQCRVSRLPTHSYFQRNASSKDASQSSLP